MCGAFKKPPELVAKAWREALAVYCEKFDSVIFAVYCNKYEMENYDTFRAVLR